MNSTIEFLTRTNVISSIITVIVALLIIIVINKKLDKIKIKKESSIITKRKNTLVKLLGNILKYIVVMIAIIVILANAGVDVSAIATSIGVIGVVAGLALQDALKDIIAGFNIIMDDYYVVGDVIKFNSYEGVVIELGLKKTKVQLYDGSILSIANREISQVVNLSASDTVLYLKLPVAYEHPLEEVEEVIDSLLKKIDRNEMSIKESKYLGIDSFEDSSIIYYIEVTCKAENRYRFKRKILTMIKKEFDEKNIKIPYNQIEVHNGK